MPQTVLHQTPAPGTRQDSGPSRAGSSRDSGDSESRFDSVSRAEQQRLEQQRNRQQDEARHTADEAADARVADEHPVRAEKQEAADTGDPDAVATGNAQPSDTSADGNPVVLPLTFTELQALVMPATGTAGQAQTDASATPATATTPGQVGMAGIINNGAKGTQATPGTLLTQVLGARQASDAGRTPDAGNLALASRFDSVMANTDTSTVTQQRLATEAAVPLRAYATSIDVPVGHGEWGDKLVGKLSWLTARNMSVAEIHLTPPDMGPMEVKVRVHNEQANITVHAANPMVRDQLELHSHRLRDMLGEQGLSLAQFDVSDSPRQQTGEQAGEGGGSASGQEQGGDLSAAASDDAELASGSLDLSWKGEVDLFA